MFTFFQYIVKWKDWENLSRAFWTTCQKENKKNIFKYIGGANRILPVLNTKSLLAIDLGYHSFCFKAFRCTGWIKQLHKTWNKEKNERRMMKQLSMDFVKKYYYLTRRSGFCRRFKKNIQQNRSKRNLPSSTRSIDIR